MFGYSSLSNKSAGCNKSVGCIFSRKQWFVQDVINVQACICQKFNNSAGCGKHAGWESQKTQMINKGLSNWIVAMHIIYTH